VPPLRVSLGFDAFGRAAVNHAQDSAPLFGLGHDGLDWIGGGTENGANFGNLTDAAQHVDGIAVAHSNHENMAGRQRLCIVGGITLQFAIIAVDPRQACSGGLIERDTEFHLRGRVHHGFVEILHRFYEVALADDEVAVLRDLEANRFQFHTRVVDVSSQYNGTWRRVTPVENPAA